MLMMLDVVANHAGPITNLSSITPFNESHHYHGCAGCTQHCAIPQQAYAGAEAWPPRQPDVDLVKTCRLVDLLDLDQSNPFVRTALIRWMQDTLAQFGFDAIRMDTVKHVDTVGWVWGGGAALCVELVGGVGCALRCSGRHAQCTESWWHRRPAAAVVLVLQPFWTDFTNAVGVFSMGEVLNGNTRCGWGSPFATKQPQALRVRPTPCFDACLTVRACLPAQGAGGVCAEGP
jgi:glycosidase